MLTFKHDSWEKYFKLTPEKISVLTVENSFELWNYCVEILRQADGDDGLFSLSKNFIGIPLDKFCIVETNIAGFSINTKKLQTALIKKCAEIAENAEFEIIFKKYVNNFYNFCKEVCQDVGYSVELNENIDTGGLFKLYSLSLKESFNTVMEKLIEFVNINLEFTKAKVFIFLFLTKFLSHDELYSFFEHCRYQGVNLILIEDALPAYLSRGLIPYQGIIIDNDGFEITKNFTDD